jgi:hypothetical protein
MKLGGKDNYAAAVLSACVLGLAVSPFFFIATGALSGFSPAFSFIVLPPLVASDGFLLSRLLKRPIVKRTRVLQLAAESVAWLVVAAFMMLVSGGNLQTTTERVGLSCSYFLLASLLCLPLTLLRDTTVDQRLRRLPRSVAIGVLLVFLSLSGAMALTYGLTPPAFIGA